MYYVPLSIRWLQDSRAPGEQIDEPSQWQPVPSVAPRAMQVTTFVPVAPEHRVEGGGGGGGDGGGGDGGGSAAEQVDDAPVHWHPVPSDAPIAMHIADVVELPSAQIVAAGSSQDVLSAICTRWSRFRQTPVQVQMVPALYMLMLL